MTIPKGGALIFIFTAGTQYDKLRRKIFGHRHTQTDTDIGRLMTGRLVQS